MEIVVGGAPCQDQPGYYYLGAKRDLCWRPLVLAQLVPCGILAGREATGGHSAQVTPPESWHFSIHSIEHGKGARMWHHHTRKPPNHITICNLIEIVCNQPYPKGGNWLSWIFESTREKEGALSKIYSVQAKSKQQSLPVHYSIKVNNLLPVFLIHWLFIFWQLTPVDFFKMLAEVYNCIFKTIKLFNSQTIDILEEIDSFYWPKMHLWKGAKKIG